MSRQPCRPPLPLLTVILLASLVVASGVLTAQSSGENDFVPVTDAMLQDPAPEDWLMWRRTLDSWGYSLTYRHAIRLVPIGFTGMGDPRMASKK